MFERKKKQRKIDEADWRFLQTVQSLNLPILTLDPQWHALFVHVDKSAEVRRYEHQLTELLKEQGKLNSENKEMQGKKKILMNQIIYNMSISDEETVQRKNDQGNMIENINTQMVQNQDALSVLPEQIKQINALLLLATFRQVYVQVDANKKRLDTLNFDIASLRDQLSKMLLEKQDREDYNNEVFGNLKDLVGKEAVDIFEAARKF